MKICINCNTLSPIPQNSHIAVCEFCREGVPALPAQFRRNEPAPVREKKKKFDITMLIMIVMMTVVAGAIYQRVTEEKAVAKETLEQVTPTNAPEYSQAEDQTHSL